MDGYCLLKKQVDKSVLVDGFTIPVAFQDVFYDQLGFVLKPGESKQIKLLIDSVEYEVRLMNIGFDRTKFTHTDLLQVRYSAKSPIACYFNQCFRKTAERIAEHYENRTGSERFRPQDDELIAIYSTPVKGTLMVDCITCQEYETEAKLLCRFKEVDLECSVDESAHIIEKQGTYKVRKLTKAIGDSLKLVYGYRCQICGQYIGEQYGSNVIHAHHIDYFTHSMNNNASNIMIVCPNHHAIIHDRNPQFDKKLKLYTYPNGYKEGLLINKHL